jgi:hypothetical protein
MNEARHFARIRMRLVLEMAFLRAAVRRGTVQLFRFSAFCLGGARQAFCQREIMKRNFNAATVLSALLLLVALAVSWVVFAYLPVSPERLTLTGGCLIVGVISSFVMYAVVTRLPDSAWSRFTIALLLVLFASVPLVSAVAQRITYSRFGFTVYGMTPIPVLDITVNQHGVLWFRPKTHQITRAELDALVTPDVHVVIVGIGWDSVAQLTDEAKQLGDFIDLRVLPTPEAFVLFNKLKAERRNVVLLAHSTC